MEFVAELHHSTTYALCVKYLLYVKVTNMTMGNVIIKIDLENSDLCSKTVGFQFCWELVACLRLHSLNDIGRPSPRRSGFDPRPVHVHRVALKEGYLRVLTSSVVIIISPVVHTLSFSSTMDPV